LDTDPAGCQRRKDAAVPARQSGPKARPLVALQEQQGAVITEPQTTQQNKEQGVVTDGAICQCYCWWTTIPATTTTPQKVERPTARG